MSSEVLQDMTVDSVPEASPAHIAERSAPQAPAVETEEDEADSGSVATFKSIAYRLFIAIAIIIVYVGIILLIWHFFKKLNKKVTEIGSSKLKPLTIKKLKILSTRQIIDVVLFSLRILKYVISILLLFITIPIVFSLFPETKPIADTIFGYILSPVKKIAFGIINYIPNLFTIIVIIFFTRYALKGLKFLSLQIGNSRLVIPGFYPEWALPTYKILQVLLLAFTIAVIYPYLPGSESRIFQGVSVLVGVIFSFGSTSIIGNLVGGIVITYMRPFKIGDRVQIKEITGFVVEKNLMVVRIKTHKNEYVTFPNLIILQSSIINYNTSSAEDEEGLILNTEITFGYATPWQTVHQILIEAALATEHVLKDPHPFVLQTALDDFYARYQINCYTKNVDKVPAIYAQLYENIQNGFKAAGLDPTAAHIHIISDMSKNQKQ